MRKIKFILFLFLFLAFNIKCVYAAKPHISISTETSVYYEKIYLTVRGDKYNNGDIWRYDNYYHNKFDKNLIDKMNGKTILNDNLYYYLIIQLATKLYNLSCKCELELASNYEYQLIPKYEASLFHMLTSALKI